MIKPLSEKEKIKLNELLQVNIVVNKKNESTSRKKPKSFKFLNKEILNNNLDFNSRNKHKLISHTFYQNFTNNYNTSRKLVYKPKRLLKISEGEIPLKQLGKATLDCAKTFYGLNTDNFHKTLYSAEKKKNNAFIPENEIMNINNQAEFKASSIVKFAQNSANLFKLKRNIELISENRKKNYEILFNKVLKLIDTQSKLCLNDDLEAKNNFSKTANTFNDIEINKSNSLNNISVRMKKLISLCLEIGSTFYKYLSLIFVELREKHNENIKLCKKSNEQDIRFNQIAKELETLQKYHNRYDVKSKLYLLQGKENSIKKIKDNLNKKENEYILNIYKLEDEIRNLTFLLDKNKDYYNKLKETKKEVENSRKQTEEIKYLYNKEIHERLIQNANEKDREEELNNKIIELEETIDKLKEDQEVNKRREIETTAKVKKIRMIVNEKSENILMLNEELEWFIRALENEKFNHNNTKTALKILENRVFKDEDKTDEEKALKEDSKDMKKNNTKINDKKEKTSKDVKLILNLSNENNKK